MTPSYPALKKSFCLETGKYAEKSGDLSIFKDICVCMQSLAGEHAAKLGLAVETLYAADLMWVLARQQVVLPTLPAADSTIYIKTWPSTISRLQCRRDFIVKNEKGELLGHGITHWVVVNMSSRRAERLPPFITEVYPKDPEFAANDIALRHPALPANLEIATWQTSQADIDLNAHVTNMRYADFMLDALPEQHYATHRLTALDMTFRAETIAGQKISSRSQTCDPLLFAPLARTDTDLAFWHSLVKKEKKILFWKKEEEKELVRGFSLWRKR